MQTLIDSCAFVSYHDLNITNFLVGHNLAFKRIYRDSISENSILPFLFSSPGFFSSLFLYFLSSCISYNQLMLSLNKYLFYFKYQKSAPTARLPLRLLRTKHSSAIYHLNKYSLFMLYYKQSIFIAYFILST